MRGRRKDRAKSSDKQGGGDSKVKERPSTPVEESPEPTAVAVVDAAAPGADPEPEPSIEVIEVEEEPDGSVQITDTVAVLEPDGSIEVERTVALLEPDGSVEVIETDEAVIEPGEADPGKKQKVGTGSPEVAAAADAPDKPAPDPSSQAQAASGNPLPRIMAVANQKGGVGKTTTSVNLGAALAELGYRVLVIDLDPQGNATTGLGIDARNFERSMYDVIMRDASLEDCIEPTSMKNLFVAPATIDLAGAEIELVPAFSRELKLKRAIETVIDDFDFVLIDCPPSLGLITVNALAAADEVLVPIQCEYYALEGLSQLMRNVHLVASNLNAGLEVSTIVLTMYDARTKLSDQVAAEVREHFGNKVCRNIIPRTVRLSEAPSFGQPITAFDPASRGAIAYRELAKEVSGGAS